MLASEVRALVAYCPESGAFTRLSGPRAGQDATRLWKTTGYYRIFIGGRDYPAHRVAWLLMTGAWPSRQIDHINGLRTDNRWSNLREATHSQNMQNQVRRGFSRTSGSTTFRARIAVDGHKFYLGSFPTQQAARDAYLEAKERLHTHKRRG